MLLALAEDLFDMDDNNVAQYITIDIQNLTSSNDTDDRATNP